MKVAPLSLLALHGNFGTAADWSRLDLPGMRTVDLWEHVRLDFGEFASALAGSISAGMDRPILAGYSLGGRLALHALARFPHRWAGAVIVSAHPGLACVEDRLARRSSDAIWAERVRTLDWAELLAWWNGQLLFGEVSESLRSRQRSLAARREEVATAFETWSLGRQEDLRPALAGFTAPVLWITGEEDRRFTRIGAEMAEVFPDFRRLVLPTCGHRVLDEAPALAAEALRESFGL